MHLQFKVASQPVIEFKAVVFTRFMMMAEEEEEALRDFSLSSAGPQSLQAL